MRVEEIMSIDLETCRADDTLNRAAQIMWEHDCGAAPVVDNEGHVVGILTDRDICMAAYTQGRPLSEISVSSACSRSVRTCKVDESLESAEAIMAAERVRRIPVVDHDGKICGILSLGDLARRVHEPTHKPDGLSYENIAVTVAAVSEPAREHSSNGDALGRIKRERSAAPA